MIRSSVIVIGLVESDIVLSVDNEVGGVNVEALHDHLEDLGLMHSTFLHKVDNLVLHHYCVIHVVIELNLHLVLELSLFVQELFVLDWLREVFVVLCEQVELADVCPRVESITHGVLSPYPHVLATSEQVQLVDLLLEVLPVEHVGHPGEAAREVEEDLGELPGPAEGIDEEDVECEGDEGVVHNVGVLEVNSAVLDVVAGVKEELTITVEL